MNATPTKDTSAQCILAWAVMLVLTLISLWFSKGSLDHSLAIVVIVTMAYVKVGIVGHTFMELNHAARSLEFSFFGISFVAWAGIISLILAL